MSKAYASLATKKTPGMDGFLTEVPRYPPNLFAPVTPPFHTIMCTGQFPWAMLEVHLIFPGKPRKPAELRSSKLPIPLLTVPSKALGAADLNRLMGRLESGLIGCQYAYR